MIRCAEVLAFQNAIAWVPRQKIARCVTVTTRWVCSSSSGPSPGGRGAWDLDRSFDFTERRPSPADKSLPFRRPRTGPRADTNSRRESSQWQRRGENQYKNYNADRRRGSRSDARDGSRNRYERSSYEESDEGADFDVFNDRQNDRRTRSYYEREPKREYERRDNGSRDNGSRDYGRRDYGRRDNGRRDYGRGGSGRRDYGREDSDGWRNRSATPSPERLALRDALDSEDDDLLYGITPVLLALQSDRREKKIQLFVQTRNEDVAPGPGPSRKVENEEAMETIMSLATQHEVAITKLPKGDLNLLSRNRPHQGIVLQASKRDYEDVKTLPDVTGDTTNERGQAPCYLVLDEITDPQNAGALLRSAYFLGAEGVIVCKRNSCGLTAVVSKASAGALEKMNVYGVQSMPRFLRGAKEAGWRIVGMGFGDDAVAARDLQRECPTLVVLGSEGRGLRTLVRKQCNVVVRIDGDGRDADVDSLNVSVAGAVALYQLLGK